MLANARALVILVAVLSAGCRFQFHVSVQNNLGRDVTLAIFAEDQDEPDFEVTVSPGEQVLDFAYAPGQEPPDALIFKVFDGDVEIPPVALQNKIFTASCAQAGDNKLGPRETIDGNILHDLLEGDKCTFTLAAGSLQANQVIDATLDAVHAVSSVYPLGVPDVKAFASPSKSGRSPAARRSQQ